MTAAAPAHASREARVVIVSTDYGPPWNEGEKNIAHVLDRRLRDHGWQPSVCSNPWSDVTASSRHRPSAVKLARAVRFWVDVGRSARRDGAALIHLLTSVSSVLGLKCRILRRAAGVPLLLHATGLARPVRGYRRLLEYDAAVVGGSYLLPFFPDAVDLPPLSPHVNARLAADARAATLAAPGGRLVYLGHMEPERGVHTLVEALGQLAGRGRTDVSLTLAWNGQGSPAYARAIDERIVALGMADRVHHVGVVDDLAALYRAHDIVVVPAAADERMGFPLRLVEALSYGRPVIVTDVGEMPRVADGCGIVVPREQPAALAAAIDRLTTDHALYAGAARRAYERAARYDPAQTLARLVALYRRLAAT